MGKFVYAVLMVFVIELALYLFGGTTYATSSLFNLLLNPSIIKSSAFYILFIVAIAAFAASAVIPGLFHSINVYTLYAGLVAILITFSFSIVHLGQFIYGELAPITTVWLTQIIITIVLAPILTYYLLACGEWIRANS